MGKNVTKSVLYMAYVFLSFVSQEELIVSKVILLPCTKLIEGKLLVCDFFENLGK